MRGGANTGEQERDEKDGKPMQGSPMGKQNVGPQVGKSSLGSPAGKSGGVQAAAGKIWRGLRNKEQQSLPLNIPSSSELQFSLMF